MTLQSKHINPQRKAYEATCKAKDHVRGIFRQKGLRVCEYEKYPGLDFEAEVTRLGENILIYVVNESPEKKKIRNALKYCETQSLDWQEILK